MKSLLFLTTTNLSTNPRLLKEIYLACSKGHDCQLVAFKLGNWSDKTETGHLEQINCQHDYLSASKKPLLPWLISTFIWKSCYLLNIFLRRSLRINAFAHNKRTWQISRCLKSKTIKYDLIVAHNLGALYPARQYAKKHNIPFTFDIEDYHPGEKCSPAEKKRREFLMKKLLPKAAYISYASPLIGMHSLKLLDGKNIPENLLINNCFSKNEFQYQESCAEKIKFVWFSQNIAAGRGLELIVPVLSCFKNQIELYLIGNLYPDFYQDFLSNYPGFIKIEKPLGQKDLNLKLSEFDIGLAIELKSADFNRDICLTNKIFAYAQSGLYILATDTSAQQAFIKENPQLGALTGQSVDEMKIQTEKILQNIEIIRNNKKNRFEYAQKLSWVNESRKLSDVWNEILNR